MLGWSITVTAASPADYHEHLRTEPVVANWTVGPMGTRWLDALVEAEDATQVRSGGYPDIYTARASILRPIISDLQTSSEEDLTGGHPRDVTIDRNRLSACPDETVLTVVVWDQS